MLSIKSGLFAAVVGFASIASAAPVVVMDGTLAGHNGGFTYGTDTDGYSHYSGWWNDVNGGGQSSPSVPPPTGWIHTSGYAWVMANGTVQTSGLVTIRNNTGVEVTANTEYTLGASLGGGTGTTMSAYVIATQLPNGGGNSVVLAELTRAGQAADAAYTAYPVAPVTGAASSPSLAGYFIQVMVTGTGTYIDNLFVTSEVVAVPEPTSLGLLGVGAAAMLRRRRGVNA